MDVKHNCGRGAMDDFTVVDNRSDKVAFVLCKGCGGIVGTILSPKYMEDIMSKIESISRNT